MFFINAKIFFFTKLWFTLTDENLQTAIAGRNVIRIDIKVLEFVIKVNVVAAFNS
ncbi:hypothetical protein ACX0G7_12910 [Flavitalea antarctica]